MKPKISFLMATKNRAAYIKDTLQSLIDQEIKEWEVIVVDDHGTDKTEDIINTFHDKRIRYFKLKDCHGQGVSCARNFAAIQACADIVAIADSDDISYPNRIMVTLKAFEKNPNGEIFYGHLDVWEEENNIIRERKTPFTPYDYEFLKEKNYIPNGTMALKREILIDNPYNSFFCLAEDYELISRLASQGKKFVFKNIKLIKYRIGTQNISIGDDSKIDLCQKYDLLVKMVRGWIPFDREILNEITKNNQ